MLSFSILLVLAWFSMGLYNCAMLWRAMIVMGCLLLGWSGWSRAAEPVVLDVRTEPTGGVRATATILFPVEPAIIQRLLTDYAHWPELFDVRMRMAEVREQDGKAFTDIRIDHALLPGERRLLSESRILPTGGLLTELKGGDFKQYRRFWKLTPSMVGLIRRPTLNCSSRLIRLCRIGWSPWRCGEIWNRIFES